jgi:hypothetical protein
MSCQNNLHQVVLAVHNYESVTKRLPPAWSRPATTGDGWSAQARILPYIEAVALAGAIDFSAGYGAATITEDGETMKVAAYRVPTYLCPSEINDQMRVDSSGQRIHYPLSYAYNAGRWFVYDPNDHRVGDGTFVARRTSRFRDVLDGLSHTLALAEVKAWNPYYRDLGQQGKMPMPSQSSGICDLGGTLKTNTGHTEWVDGRVHQTGFTTTFSPNHKVLCSKDGVQYDVDFTNMREGKTTTARTYAAVTARSYHVGGVHTGMMDGSVQLISDSIELTLWQNLSTRAGHELVQVPE